MGQESPSHRVTESGVNEPRRSEGHEGRRKKKEEEVLRVSFCMDFFLNIGSDSSAYRYSD